MVLRRLRNVVGTSGTKSFLNAQEEFSSTLGATNQRLGCFRRMSSVATQEVEKFSSMNQSWWEASRNPLIHMNATRVGYIVNQLPHSNNSPLPLQNKKALDIGCGGGLLSESLARLGARVTAVDPSEDLVEVAKLHAQLDARTRTIDYQSGLTAEDLVNTHAESFDVVCLLEVIEHASDVESLVQAAARLVKPGGGTLFISTMNQTWKSYLLTIVGAEYIMGYLPIGTHNWNQYLSPAQVAELTSLYGLREKHVCGMVLDKPPLFGSWDWRLDENDTDVNWIAVYQKR